LTGVQSEFHVGALRVRSYGQHGPIVLVLHGGPGAPGYMAPVARELAGAFRVFEPLQRASGGPALTVERHVDDLRKLLGWFGAGERPALVGSSWGAMLALAFAASHPGSAGPLVLVGCGTFDRKSRAKMREILDRRQDAALRSRLEGLPAEFPDPDQRLAAAGRLIQPLYTYDGIAEDPEPEPCDARANEETWSDMLRLQAEGRYPAAFRAIASPVLMLHGAFDPHPGGMIRASLEPFIPHLEYREWENCGHYPWLERQVREEFFGVLRAWLSGHLPAPRPAHRHGGP
jgi:pimeloyl-ACP methyl ester carboxylesterase